MAKSFDEIVQSKSDDELAEMRAHLSNFVPFKQRTIQAETERRETQARHAAIVRSEARAVTMETLEEWFREAFAEDMAGRSNEDIITAAISNLVGAGNLKIPRGGYLITHTKSGITVKQPGKKKPAKPQNRK